MQGPAPPGLHKYRNQFRNWPRKSLGKAAVQLGMAKPGQRIDLARFSTGRGLADFSPKIFALSPGQI
jgi:hypothetical protein